MTDASETFADHVLGTGFEDLPENAVEAAKIFILDTLGVGAVGTNGPWVEEWKGGFQAVVPGEGARVWGTGERLPTPAAAAVNGYLIHNSEYDCVHEAAVLHPMAVLFSALMAEVEGRGDNGLVVDGKTLIRAVTLGVDVACHIGNSVTSGLKFFRPATAGGFGATTAISVIAGLNKEQILNAYGLYYAQAGGSMQAHTEGLPLLGMQVGFCSRNAVVATRMAERGIPGTRGTIEGPFGYLNLMEGSYDREALLDDIGKVWRIAEVAHKPWPSGRATHGLLDVLSDLEQQHGFSAGQVAMVKAKVPPLTERLIGRPVKEDMNVNYARISGPYTGARLILNGTIGIGDFTEEALRDQATLDLGRRIVIENNGNPDQNALTPITVEVALSTGEVLHAKLETVYGNPAKPMSREAHLSKFRTNLKAAQGPIPEENADKLIEMVDRLEELDDARKLIDLVVAG